MSQSDFEQVLKQVYDPVLNALRITGGGGSPGAHQSSHQAGGADALTGLLNATARVAVLDTGTLIGTRRGINFLDGSNLTFAIADDPANEEVEVSGVIGDLANANIAAGAAIAESKLGLNFATHSNANDPTAGEKAALPGTSGVVGAGNKYVTDADPRNSDSRVPLGHKVTHEPGGSDALTLLDNSSIKAAAGIVESKLALNFATHSNALDHAQSHVLATTAGLGADHTTSGLTAGQYLRATGAATAAFQVIPAADLPAHSIRHISGGADTFQAGDNLDATARIQVRENSAGTVYARRRLNLIEGANIALTLADDIGSEEVDITLSVTGAMAPAAHASTHQMGGADQLEATLALGVTSLHVDLTAMMGSTPTLVLAPGSSDVGLISVAQGVNAIGARFAAVKTRSTGTDANVIVANADDLLDITAYGADGAAYVAAAQIMAEVDGAPSLGNVPGRLGFYTRGASGLTNRLQIASTGIVSSSGPVLLGDAATLDSDLTAILGATPKCVVFGETSVGIGLSTVTNGATTLGACLAGIKTRTAGSYNANTVVVNGDCLLDLGGWGADGAAYRQAGRILIEVDGTPGASDMPGRVAFYTTPDGGVTPVERMRVTNAGRVGIATTAPISTLQVNGQTYLGPDTALDADVGFLGTPPLIVCDNPAVNYNVAVIGNGANNTGPTLAFLKTRAASGNSANTPVVVNDAIMELIGYIAVNNVYNEAARIRMAVDGGVGVADFPSRIQFYTTPDAGGLTIERLRIDNVGSLIHYGANFQATNIKQATVSVTTSADPSDAANLIPAGSMVIGVTCGVTTALTGTLTTWQIGTIASPTLYGAAIAKAATTSTDLEDAVNLSSPLIFNVATTLRIKPTSGTLTGGVIRVTVHYISLTAPTS